MIKAVIFDLDGTLVNSLSDLADSTNYSLKLHGFNTHPVEAYKYLVGDGMAKLIERGISNDQVDEKLFKAVFDDFMAYYREHFLVNTEAYDGISELLDELKNMDMKLAVVSNKSDDMAKKVVSSVFGDGVFDVVTGKRAGLPTKPDPALTLLIIKELGLTPDECVFVGDSGMDTLNAVNAGCYPLGVLWGFRSENELLQNGAKALAAEPSEILEIIKGL